MPEITFSNWLAEHGLPSMSNQLQTEPDLDGRPERIERAVREALERLSDDERELVMLHYFDGLSLVEIARRADRAAYKVETMHRRAIAKLRRSLAAFVEAEFEITMPVDDCPLCRSRHRGSIDQIIRERDRRRTWAPVLRCLRDEFGIEHLSVQRLIGHVRYHLQPVTEGEIE